jgi:hypothetical protein
MRPPTLEHPAFGLLAIENLPGKLLLHCFTIFSLDLLRAVSNKMKTSPQ